MTTCGFSATRHLWRVPAKAAGWTPGTRQSAETRDTARRAWGPGRRRKWEPQVPRCPEEQEKAHKPPAAPRRGSCSPAVAQLRNTAPHGSAWVFKGNQKTGFFCDRPCFKHGLFTPNVFHEIWPTSVSTGWIPPLASVCHLVMSLSPPGQSGSQSACLTIISDSPPCSPPGGHFDDLLERWQLRL